MGLQAAKQDNVTQQCKIATNYYLYNEYSTVNHYILDLFINCNEPKEMLINFTQRRLGYLGYFSQTNQTWTVVYLITNI